MAKKNAGNAAGAMSAGEGLDETTNAPEKGETELVKFADGKSIEFTGKKRLEKISTIAESGTVTVDLYFRNGSYTAFTIGPSAALFAKFAAHGIEQKLGDETAGVKDIEDAYEGVVALIDRLNTGEWGKERAAASGLSGASILLKALVEVKGKTVDECRAFLGKLNPAQKIALRNSTALQPVIQRLEAEKAARATSKGEKVDGDDLLSQFGEAA